MTDTELRERLTEIIWKHMLRAIRSDADEERVSPLVADLEQLIGEREAHFRAEYALEHIDKINASIEATLEELGEPVWSAPPVPFGATEGSTITPSEPVPIEEYSDNLDDIDSVLDEFGVAAFKVGQMYGPNGFGSYPSLDRIKARHALDAVLADLGVTPDAEDPRAGRP